ncbi:MAG: spore cortex-lytic enzyme [Paenibacillaceae bacterium ZCTH02-B3]|nr:MAG: spore cortex-lytic enzyme [Paenibacillaceae bacterium ZCTH02-B3]
MHNRVGIVAVSLALFIAALGFLAKIGADRAVFSDWVLTEGARGDDVYELQGRLKYLGYYDGKVDGVFGPKTKNAVTWFQWRFGLKADGIVGPKTKLKLWEATKNWRPGLEEQGGGGTATASSTPRPAGTGNISENDIRLMANAVYGEARGEPYEGQVAVAAVILNRVRSPLFPDTVPGVIFQPGAFTAVSDGQIWMTPNETALRAAQDAVNGWDPTDGCLYYFNPATATNKWIWSRPQYKKIGKHIFCR